MKMSRPVSGAVYLACGREAERLIERDRGGVRLVGVELDALRSAQPRPLEGELDECPSDAAPAACVGDVEVLEPAVGRTGPDGVAEAKLADAARRLALARATEQVLGRRILDQRATEAAIDSASAPRTRTSRGRRAAGATRRPPRPASATQTAVTRTRSPQGCRLRRPRRRPRSGAPRSFPPCAR